MGIMHVAAYQIIDLAVQLLNDPAKTDYTYDVVLPFVNMAVNELNEHLQEANVAFTNQTSLTYPIKVGDHTLTNVPSDLVEIQEVFERRLGSDDAFIPLPRKEFPESLQQSDSLLFWCWMDQTIKFNQNGATVPREIKLNYIRTAVVGTSDIHGVIGPISSVNFLMYKTAALCSLFIGENETRSGVLNEQADLALERIISISNKGRQQIMTRHRPFRARYKMGGY